MPSSCVSGFLDCSAAWYGSQAANNTFTLLGAIATAVATIVALVLSQQQSRRLAADRRTRAELCLRICIPTTVRTTERLRLLLGGLKFDAHAQRAHGSYAKALAWVMQDLATPSNRLDIETAIALVPLGFELGELLASGFASFELAQHYSSGLSGYATNNAFVEPRQPPEAVALVIEGVEDALKEFVEALHAMVAYDKKIRRETSPGI